MKPFNVCLAHMLPSEVIHNRWLIETLWGLSCVGIIGGEPKCCKSFLGLELAIAVASGVPCLGRFPVHKTGPVLLFAAEDALSTVKERLAGLCRRKGLDLASLPIHILTEPRIRLDVQEDCLRLAATVEKVRPLLLLLDPFVRMHQVDENVAAAVAPLLNVLRDLQRTYDCAVVLVHHARKGAGNLRAGQALRGSSELHAWLDASLFLRRKGERLRMWIEHRALPSAEPFSLRLDAQDDAVGLVIDEASPPAPELSSGPPTSLPPEERVLNALAEHPSPLSVRRLQQLCRVRTQTLCAILDSLVQQGQVLRLKQGFALADSDSNTVTTPDTHDSAPATPSAAAPMAPAHNPAPMAPGPAAPKAPAHNSAPMALCTNPAPTPSQAFSDADPRQMVFPGVAT